VASNAIKTKLNRVCIPPWDFP